MLCYLVKRVTFNIEAMKILVSAIIFLSLSIFLRFCSNAYEPHNNNNNHNDNINNNNSIWLLFLLFLGFSYVFLSSFGFTCQIHNVEWMNSDFSSARLLMLAIV